MAQFNYNGEKVLVDGNLIEEFQRLFMGEKSPREAIEEILLLHSERYPNERWACDELSDYVSQKLLMYINVKLGQIYGKPLEFMFPNGAMIYSGCEPKIGSCLYLAGPARENKIMPLKTIPIDNEHTKAEMIMRVVLSYLIANYEWRDNEVDAMDIVLDVWCVLSKSVLAERKVKGTKKGQYFTTFSEFNYPDYQDISGVLRKYDPQPYL